MHILHANIYFPNKKKYFSIYFKKFLLNLLNNLTFKLSLKLFKTEVKIGNEMSGYFFDEENKKSNFV